MARRYGATLTSDEIVRGIIRANYHKSGPVKALRLYTVHPALMDKIRQDAAWILASQKPSIVTDAVHVTNWTKPSGDVRQFSLFNRSGCTDDTADDHTRTAEGKRFHLANRAPGMRELAEFLAGAGLMGMRMNVLGPDSKLSPHEEHIVHRGAAFPELRVRFHLPITTNAGALVLLDGDLHHLESGIIHFFNNGCVHAAENGGQDDRVHLVWDMMLTEMCQHLMFAGGLPAEIGRPCSSTKVPLVGRRDIGSFERYPDEVPFEEAETELGFVEAWA